MKFIIGEDWETLWERFEYRGCIGLFYNNTWEGVLAYIVVGLICLLAIIGIITVVKWLLTRNHNNYDKHNKSGLSKDEYKWLHSK